MSETPRFECSRCGAQSANAKDVREGYCGQCHDWTAPRSDKPETWLRLGQSPGYDRHITTLVGAWPNTEVRHAEDRSLHDFLHMSREQYMYYLSPSMGECLVCNKPVPGAEALDHLRLFHPEQWGDGPMTWPDGELVIIDTTAETPADILREPGSNE